MEEIGRRMEEVQGLFLKFTEIHRSEFVGPRIKACLHDEGFTYILKRRDFTEDPKRTFGEKSRVAG